MAAAAVRGTSANSAVNVGVIGTGNRGSYVASMLAKHTPGRIVALCDVQPEQMEAAKKEIGVDNPRLYEDYRRMLADPGVDALIIATPVFRGGGEVRQAHLYRKTRLGRRRRMQAHHARGRCGRPQNQY
jgi:threonine dehydrogenase-like Zn-dependent dehydrogenase